MPSDRLLRFRQYMAAFEGSADPAKSIDHGHYVHAPGQLLVDQIAGRIALRPNSTHLLVGSIGSGKTTQLLVAKQQLESVDEGLLVHYVDVSRYTDINQVEPGVLMAIVAIELADLIPSPIDGSIQAALESLEMIAFGYTTTQVVDPMAAIMTMSNHMGRSLSPRKQTTTHKGLLRQVQEDKPIVDHELENVFQTILTAVTQRLEKTLVVLIDGLDRLDDTQKFSQMIRTDLQPMKAFGIGTVIVGPLLFTHSLHQGTKDLMDYSYYQPCFDVENSQEAQMFFANVIAKRLPETDFFGSAAIQQLVKASGGVLRDLVTLTQAAIEEVYIAGDETLEIRHIEKALQTWARSRMSGISELEVAILRNHLQGKGFVLGSPESLKLLESRRVLEYNYPTVRYAVHPAIVPLLQPVAASA